MCIVGRVFQQPLQCFFLGSCFGNSKIGATGPQNIRLIPTCFVVYSLLACFIQNNFPLLVIVACIVAADDMCGAVVPLFFIGFGDKIDVCLELFLIAFTVRRDEFPDSYSVNLIHSSSHLQRTSYYPLYLYYTIFVVISQFTHKKKTIFLSLDGLFLHILL